MICPHCDEEITPQDIDDYAKIVLEETQESDLREEFEEVHAEDIKRLHARYSFLDKILDNVGIILVAGVVLGVIISFWILAVVVVSLMVICIQKMRWDDDAASAEESLFEYFRDSRINPPQ